MISQYITFSPDIVVINEFENFSASVTITHTLPLGVIETYDYVFHDVIRPTVLPIWTSFIVTPVSSMVFSISGNLYDMFDRSIQFLDKNEQKTEVKHFSELPSDYKGVYKYIGAAEPNIKIPAVVRMRPAIYSASNVPPNLLDSYELTLLVNSNFRKANELFVQTVQNGSLAKSAAALGIT